MPTASSRPEYSNCCRHHCLDWIGCPITVPVAAPAPPAVDPAAGPAAFIDVLRMMKQCSEVKK